jgi:Tol biopolymer transport system component
LAGTDTNGTWDVFVRDLRRGTTALVSVNLSGTDSGNAISGSIPVGTGFAFSASGRFIAFESKATDLVAVPASGRGDVFVRDLEVGRTRMVSVNRSGTRGGNGPFASSAPVISADGQYVAFQSSAGDLVSHDTNGDEDVFVRDIHAERTTLISVNLAGTNSGNRFSFEPSISADGRLVAFSSRATDLVAGADTNGGALPGTSETTDVFVRDWLKGATQVVSVNRSGTDTANGGAGGPIISADGHFVSFVSSSSDLVAEDRVQKPDVFIRPVR